VSVGTGFAGIGRQVLPIPCIHTRLEFDRLGFSEFERVVEEKNHGMGTVIRPVEGIHGSHWLWT